LPNAELTTLEGFSFKSTFQTLPLEFATDW